MTGRGWKMTGGKVPLTAVSGSFAGLFKLRSYDGRWCAVHGVRGRQVRHEGFLCSVNALHVNRTYCVERTQRQVTALSTRVCDFSLWWRHAADSHTEPASAAEYPPSACANCSGPSTLLTCSEDS